MAQAELISAEQVKFRRGAPESPLSGAYGGPAREAVETQIAHIRQFVQEHDKV